MKVSMLELSDLILGYTRNCKHVLYVLSQFVPKVRKSNQPNALREFLLKCGREPNYSCSKVGNEHQSSVEGFNRPDNLNSPVCVGTPQSQHKIASKLPKLRFSIVYCPLETECSKDVQIPETWKYEHWVDLLGEGKPFAKHALNLINGFERCQYQSAKRRRDALKWRIGMQALAVKYNVNKFSAFVLFLLQQENSFECVLQLVCISFCMLLLFLFVSLILLGYQEYTLNIFST